MLGKDHPFKFLATDGNQMDPIDSHKKVTSYICNSLFLSYTASIDMGKDLVKQGDKLGTCKIQSCVSDIIYLALFFFLGMHCHN